MQTYPAPSALQVRPSFISPGQFSLYWVVPGTNLGTAVTNSINKPAYDTVQQAIDCAVSWHGLCYSRKPKAPVFIETPMENMLVRVSK
jgi:hypothetical protein